MDRLNHVGKLSGVSAIALFSMTLQVSQASAQINAGADSSRGVPDAVSIKDIVVTAQKRDQALSDVPISIQALDASVLENRSIRTVDDVAATTPGLDFGVQNGGTGYANRNIISIRGVASTAGAATTGVYIDDYTIQARATNFQVAGGIFPRVFDLERVEVLRGPQGTLFGAGAEGGVVRFITPSPDLSKAGLYVHGEGATISHGDESYEFGVAGGVPIIQDKVAFRASIMHRRDGGYVDRQNYQTGEVFKDSNYSDVTVGRFSLLIAPNDSLEIKPAIYYQKVKVHDVSSFWEHLSDPKKGKFVTGEALQQPNSDEFVMPTLDVNWSSGGVAVESRTGYLDRKFRNESDYTNFSPEISGFGATPLGGTMLGTQSQDMSIFSQEVRIRSNTKDSRLNWLVGAYYQDSKQTDRSAINGVFLDQLFKTLPFFPNGVIDLFGEGLVDDQFFVRGHSVYKESQLAGFGQIDYEITDKLTFTAGLRVAENKTTLTQLSEGPLSGFTLNTASTKESVVTPKATVAYKIDRDNMVYATYAAGYRPGGPNASVPAKLTLTCESGIEAIGGTGSTPPPYKRDRTDSFEVGSKNQFLGGRLGINSSAYYVKWKNVQQFLAVPNCGGVGFFSNTGDARVYGFDIQATAALTNHLRLGLNLGVTDAKYTTTTMNAGGQIVSNKGDTILGPTPASGSPTGILPWTLGVTLDYDVPLGGDMEGYLGLDYKYQPHNDGKSAIKDDPLAANYDPENRFAPSISILNMRVGIKKGGWNLYAFADNVLDRTPAMGRSRNLAPNPLSFTPDGSAIFYLTTVRPRTIGLGATYRLGN